MNEDAFFYNHHPSSYPQRDGDRESGAVKDKFVFQSHPDEDDSSRAKTLPSSHRPRFSVEYSPAIPRPPLHPPSWMTLETAEQRLAAAAEQWQEAADAATEDWNPAVLPTLQSMLVGAISGLWTAAPILYFHCLHHSTAGAALYLFPFALVAAALEAAALAGTLVWTAILEGQDVNVNDDDDDDEDAPTSLLRPAIVSLFVILRVLVGYLLGTWTMVGIDDGYYVHGIYELLESVVLFGSSSLAVEAFWSPLKVEEPSTTTNPPSGRNHHHHNNNNNNNNRNNTDDAKQKRRKPNFQRGTKW